MRININLPPNQGGKQSFDRSADALAWLDERIEEWTTAVGSIANIALPIYSPLRALTRRRDEVRSLRNEERSKSAPIEINLDSSDIILESSPAGRALIFTLQQIGPEGASAAAVLAGVRGNINWQDQTQIAAISAYKYLLDAIMESEHGDRASELATAENRLKVLGTEADNLLSTLKNELTNAKDSVQNLNTNVQTNVRHAAEQHNQVQSTLASLKAVIDQEIKNVPGAIENQVSLAKSEIESFVSAYNEQIKLETAVALWNTRSVEHKSKSDISRRFAIMTGAVSLLLTGVVAKLSYEGAHNLFSEQSSTFVSQSGDINPFFHFEFAMTVAATLSFLTFAIWLVRLLVRSYSTQDHLSIDASARAALAQTYFSLIKEQAATTEDRAIVLSAIFRPVADGLVKDDGLIALTPAAAISTLLSAKSPGATS